MRRVIQGLALALALAGPASAQEVELRLAHVAPPQSAYQDAAERFASRLDELSGGTMAVSVVPGGALGDVGQLWVQARAGALDLHLIDLSALTAMREAQPFLVLWTPFLFEDQAHFRRFAASATLERLMGEVEAATGLVYLGLVGDRAPRALSTASTPVRTPEDLEGLKIRTPEHPLIVRTFESWGAAPTPLKASDLFTALRTGLVDGQDNGAIDLLDAGYADAQGHYTPLDYIHSGLGLWMSPARWAEMSEEQRGWLREAARRAGEEGAAAHDAAMAEALERLPEVGIAVTEPDLAAFRRVKDGLVEAMEGEAWPQGLVAEIEGL